MVARRRENWELLFWRLLDNENPCTGEREIIEIVMDPPPGAPPKKTATAPQQQPKKN